MRQQNLCSQQNSTSKRNQFEIGTDFLLSPGILELAPGFVCRKKAGRCYEGSVCLLTYSTQSILDFW